MFYAVVDSNMKIIAGIGTFVLFNESIYWPQVHIASISVFAGGLTDSIRWWVLFVFSFLSRSPAMTRSSSTTRRMLRALRLLIKEKKVSDGIHLLNYCSHYPRTD